MPLPSSHRLYGWPEGEAIAMPERFNADPSRPLFSIVIPTLNQGPFIEDTLLSILWQGYDNVEIIVVDGGSTDETPAVLERYRPWIRVLIREPDKGQSDAINKGFRQSSGSILAWLNSDDIYLPGAFRTVLGCFAADSSGRWVIGSGDIISADQQFLRHVPAREGSEQTLLAIENDCFLLQQSCFWSASLWQEAGGRVDESLSLLMDYDLWWRFSQRCSGIVTQEKLGAMRYYATVKTRRQGERFPSELATIYARYGASEPLERLVHRLLKEKSALDERLQTLERQLPVRLLKRLRLLPRP
ncbi:MULTISPECIES: glycosyltransferase family 2 protein [unclassified Cyanobium]|uniref:glycosyltransferase family 2 protein n=1 Tax=unclassified Cyanobium TaxID=2627006 RepID=UPI0020CF8DBD|nr:MULTISPECIES: glycosyltransferase family 2 protein [unclassified Cyanobium]MCP9833658.1 glycosyltransferase [Cyanobium sp. La Preciosa 7G6]MCP9936584.1 glycosyltransferase [Cyanobium sp. Aljojuca 7A6]